jgi:hypothetical protein
MSVTISFMRAATAGAGAAAVSTVRKKEVVTIGNSTTITALPGEVGWVYNGETSGILVAWGSSPDAQATTATSATTAGFAVPAGMCGPIMILASGDTVNVKTIA